MNMVRIPSAQLLNNKFIQMKKSFIIYLLLFSVTACKNNKEEVNTSKETLAANEVVLTAIQQQNAKLEIGTLQQKAIATTLKVNGRIDVPPQNLVSVSAPLGGYLKDTKLLPGMHISKGEVIATLEDQQFIQLQQDYLTTKSKLYFAEKEYERQKEMNASLASSTKNVTLADAEVRMNKILLSGLSEKLKLIHLNPAKVSENNISKNVNIYSPINGYVSKVNVNIGKYVAPTDVLFELINPLDIHLNLHVFEKDVAQLFIGQKLVAFTNTNPDKKFTCEIILISKNISQDGTTEVHCHFDNYDKNLLPGMYMNAELDIKSSAGFALPETAIVNYEGKQYAYEVIDNLKYAMVEIIAGARSDGFVEVKNYQQLQNKKLVLNGAYTLLMKMKNVEEE
jgi:cobalt-zinc-cadmium efflux system membrane fusion protein